MGQATTDLNQVLQALNDRNDIIRRTGVRSRISTTPMRVAAPDIVAILNAGSTLSTTIATWSPPWTPLLLNTTGSPNRAVNYSRPPRDPPGPGSHILEPTTNPDDEVQPVYTCWLQGAYWTLTTGDAYNIWGRQGREVGQLRRRPAGRQRPLPVPLTTCRSSRPWADRRQTGMRVADPLQELPRPFAGDQHWLGAPAWTFGRTRVSAILGWADYFPVTRAVPEPPSIRSACPALLPGPDMGPGMPPWAAWPDPAECHSWPGVPPAPAPPPAPNP